MQCQFITNKRKQCSRNAKDGQKFCYQHLNCENNETEQSNHRHGKIFIASMNLRGKRAEKPDPSCLTLNVTSAQHTNSQERHDFSPMSEVKGGYKKYYCFENYWQSCKVFEGIPHETSQKWWLSLKKPKRRYPQGKGRKVLYTKFNGKKLNYVDSRKQIYVPEYYQLIQGTTSLNKWKKLYDNGACIVIYDFDGPRSENGDPICLELTCELLIDKINNLTFPFGHSYIVGATLIGLKPTDYT